MDGIIIDIAVGFIDVNLVIGASSMEMLLLTYFCGVVFSLAMSSTPALVPTQWVRYALSWR